jgi:hypothetical protein
VVPRLAGAAALLLAATVVLAQDAKTIKIEFSGEGKREVWIQDKGKLSELPERTSSSGKAITIDAPSSSKDMVVLVRDVEKNNVATKPLDQVVKAGSWKVADGDYGYAFIVPFSVLHDDKPVVSAIVHMGDRQELVSIEDEGVALFHIVPFGDVEVTVDYKSGGEDKSLAAQTFEAKKDMGVGPVFALVITDDVATIEPKQTEGTEVGATTEPGAKTDDVKEPETPKTNAFSTFLNMLIGLAVVGGIGYAIWRFVQSNPDKTKDLLQKGGVPMPGDDPGAAPVAPAKAGPPKQILLDDAAPLAAAAAPVVDAGPVVKNPRLVKSDGSLYIVQDGDQTVGRENAALTIGGESSVSRTHARLTRTGDAVMLEDAGSTNGTFVNGQRLSGPRALVPGDSVQFGAVQYRYEE